MHRVINFSWKLLVLSFFLFSKSYAHTLPQPDFDSQLQQLYHTTQLQTIRTIAKRIEVISAYFLGAKYELGSLGEGSLARFDQYPLYRLDAFDCETFVTTVLALAFADSKESYQTYLHKLRYHNGVVQYQHRNHFVSLDWNVNNQRQGVIADVTDKIIGENSQPLWQLATTIIDKPSWYQHHTIETIRLHSASNLEREARLTELQALGKQEKKMTSTITYIPFDGLFDEQGQANLAVFQQIPTPVIIEIVRPNWDLTKQIGTHLAVSHLGFGIRHQGEILFRQASSKEGKVVDIPLIAYLQSLRSSPTIKGIHLEKIS